MTHVSRILLRALVAGLALVLPLALLPHADAAVPQRAGTSQRGDASLAALLTSDGDRFDHSWSDFDITTEAVLAVVAAKPSSKVALLADGTVPLTAFVPTDRAFWRLGRDVLGHKFKNEGTLFNALVKNLGVRGVEKVLLYHVVPGKTIGSGKVLKSDGAKLVTALGTKGNKKITVHVISKKRVLIFLGDRDHDARDPRVLRKYLDLNQGNMQIAHGINRVLRPANL